MWSAWIDVAVFVALVNLYWSEHQQTTSRIRRLEDKLAFVIRELHLNIADPMDAELKALLDGGRDIEAIKTFRTVTGATLKDAKDYVEQLKSRDSA